MTGLHKRINSRLDKAIWEHKMFKDNDRVLLTVSGGADSMALAYLLNNRIHIYAHNIQLHAVYVDMGFGDSKQKRIQIVEDYFKQLGIPTRIINTHIGTYSHGKQNRLNPCFLCSRLRRKEIFHVAEKLECQSIVFAHHKDDVVETLLLNMIFSREISTMIADLGVFGGRYHILRPLYYVEESMIKRFVLQKNIPTFDQECPTDGNSKRRYVKELVDRLEKDHRGARENIFKSLRHVKTDYLS